MKVQKRYFNISEVVSKERWNSFQFVLLRPSNRINLIPKQMFVEIYTCRRLDDCKKRSKRKSADLKNAAPC